jgi:uncharacterized protein YbjT (DUF2867 family)
MGDMEKVLVTGATGFIGYEVAKQLADQGLRPRLLVRRPFRGMHLESTLPCHANLLPAAQDYAHT